jgi:N-acylneuraminate cytidylyltransferase
LQLCDPIDAVVFDFDGVMTDNRVLVMDDGREAVFCDRMDGMGVGLLRERGIPLLILSKEKNPVVGQRARKLSVECLQGIDDKLAALRQWLSGRKLRLEHTVYVGNDVNDLECMRACGTAVCPSDAHPAALAAAAVVLSKKGGRGAVRELADAILFRAGKSKIP